MARALAPAAILSLALSLPAWAEQQVKNLLVDSETWQDLRYDVVGDAQIKSADTLLSLDAPYRAHDAATVPIVLKQLDPDAEIFAATVVIDENPAPIAGVFTFSPAMGELDFEMRVRVDQYSNVRVIAETPDGLHMTGRFVKASGGCSAPASKDPEVALASMGKMKLRSFGEEAQVQLTTPANQIMILGTPTIPACSAIRSRNCGFQRISSTISKSGRVRTLSMIHHGRSRISLISTLILAAFRFAFARSWLNHVPQG